MPYAHLSTTPLDRSPQTIATNGMPRRAGGSPVSNAASGYDTINSHTTTVREPGSGSDLASWVEEAVVSPRDAEDR